MKKPLKALRLLFLTLLGGSFLTLASRAIQWEPMLSFTPSCSSPCVDVESAKAYPPRYPFTLLETFQGSVRRDGYHQKRNYPSETIRSFFELIKKPPQASFIVRKRLFPLYTTLKLFLIYEKEQFHLRSPRGKRLILL